MSDALPLAAKPGENLPGSDKYETRVYVFFSAGRRDGGDADCRVCGESIHQRQEPDGPWRGGNGDTREWNPQDGWHTHAPADAEGPVFGPFEYLDVTYLTVRHEGVDLAHWNAERQDWQLGEAAGEYAGLTYSDMTIWPRLA